MTISSLKDRLALIFLRIRHWREPYIAFYRAAMKRRTAVDYKRAVGGKWDTIGPHQFEFLKQRGLQPHHTLLDFGCGSLRGGQHFITYLDTGNYYGVDISPEIIEIAKKLVTSSGLTDKQPHVSVNTDLELDDFGGKKFDFINAQSVLSHMPKEDILVLFSNLHKVMHDTTQFIATFFAGERYQSAAYYMDFHYPIEMLQDMATQHGLNLQILEDENYNRRQTIALITKK